VGSAVALGLALSLPLALGALPPPTDLGAELLLPQPYVILDGPQAPRPSVVLDAPSGERAVVRDWPDVAGSGLNLRTWRVDYGHRWEREVTVPFLVGPFEREDAGVCGWSVHLNAGLFDMTGAGAGLKAALHREISSNFPYSVRDEDTGISVTFPEVRKTEVGITFKAGYAQVHVVIELVDDTQLTADVPVRISSQNGTPVVKRAGPVGAQWQGPTREKLLQDAADFGAMQGGGLVGLGGCALGPVGCLVGALIGVDVGSDQGRAQGNVKADERVQSEITNRVDEALEHVALGMNDMGRAWAPLPQRPFDTIQLRLASDPLVSPGGITLSLCASVHVAMPKLDNSVPGWPRVATAHPLERNRSNVPGAFIELTADADAINQAMYLLWQSGTLRELGHDSAMLNALPEGLRNLAFDVKGFDPGLPPTAGTQASQYGIPMVLGDVTLGAWENRRVIGHAIASIGVEPSGEAVELRARFEEVSVNCVESTTSSTRLTPCLSDLLPAVRDMLAERPFTHRLTGADILGRLPALTFQGLRLELSNLQARTPPGPSSLRVKVDARIW
jgi:hypothetical protein